MARRTPRTSPHSSRRSSVRASEKTRSTKTTTRPARSNALLRATRDQDAASIDALFDAFARNLARTLSHRSASGPDARKGEGSE